MFGDITPENLVTTILLCIADSRKVVGHPEVLDKLHMSLLPTIRAHSIYSSFTAFWAAISNG